MTHTGTAQPRGQQTGWKSLQFMATTSKSSLMLQTSSLCSAVWLGSTHSTNPGEEHSVLHPLKQRCYWLNCSHILIPVKINHPSSLPPNIALNYIHPPSWGELTKPVSSSAELRKWCNIADEKYKELIVPSKDEAKFTLEKYQLTHLWGNTLQDKSEKWKVLGSSSGNLELCLECWSPVGQNTHYQPTWGHGDTEDCSSKVKHHFLWIRECATHGNTKHLESVSISLHTISRMRGDISWLPPGPLLRAFHCLNLYISTVLLTITVSSYWEARETTVSGSNFIPVFHGRTPWLSGNHGILSVSQRNRQIQDTSSAAVDGQLLWTPALSTSKPQTLRKSLAFRVQF